MKIAWTCLVILVLFCGLVTFYPSPHAVQAAQGAASLVEIDIVQGPWATNCQTHTGITTYCYATDALAVSIAGAAYTKFQGVAGPTGPTGPAGPQGPAGTGGTAGVTALNGHTGSLTMTLGTTPISITP